MILADNRDALQYLGINPNLDAALKRLSEGVFDVEPGSYPMDGKNVWLNCFEYDTIPEEESFYEAHKLYGDIHIMTRGCEKVFISRPDDLTETDASKPDNDFYAYHGDAAHTLVLRPGTFLVVFPGDAHNIKMQVNGKETVRKAVFKFKL